MATYFHPGLFVRVFHQLQLLDRTGFVVAEHFQQAVHVIDQLSTEFGSIVTPS
jgi:hypothetical protein